MADYTGSDKWILDDIFNQLMRHIGVRESTFRSIFSDLLNSTDSSYVVYVSASGNDSGTGTLNSPFRTLQKAINSIPKKIRHLVTVSLGAGNFTGCIIQGFSVEHSSTSIAGLNLTGTLVNATVATGTATGTATSTVAGNATIPTWSVLNDTNQSWTVDDLKDKLLEYTTAGGSLAYFPIVSNTATSITLQNAAVSIPNNTIYTIKDWGTIIDTPIQYAPNFGSASLRSAGILFTNINESNLSNSFQVDGIKINLSTTATNIVASIPSILITKCNLTSALGGCLQLDRGTITCNRSVLNSTSASSTNITTSNNPTCSLTFNIIKSSSGNGLILDASKFVISTCTITGQAIGIKIQETASVELGAVKISSIVSQAIRMRTVGATPLYGSQLLVSSGLGLEISNSTTGIEIFGPSYVNALGSISGSGNTTGIDLREGARCQVTSGTSITGTTQVSLDGVATTLATMRAAPSKVISNVYFTIFYET